MYSRPVSRRRHPAELKDKVLAACEEPGASVAAVAQAHGLNANLVHKWRRCRDARQLSSTARVAPAKLTDLSLPPAVVAAPTAPSMTGAVTTQQPGATRTLTDAASAFVPLQLEMPSAAPADIRLELHRGAATVIVNWPVQQAAACGSWLREWLG